jgi:hypothetical protein
MSVATIYSERMFRRFETDLGPCADKLRIPRAIFREPDFELSIDKYYRLLDCASRTTNPRIGLTIGSGMEAGDLGPLGHAAAASADVRQMLGVLSRYLYVFAHSNVLRIDVGPRLFAVAYDVTDSNIAMHQQDVELALAYAVRQIRALTGTEASPRIVELRTRNPPTRRICGSSSAVDAIGRWQPAALLAQCAGPADPLERSEPAARAGDLSLERLKVCSEDADSGKKVVHLISTSLSSGCRRSAHRCDPRPERAHPAAPSADESGVQRDGRVRAPRYRRAVCAAQRFQPDRHRPDARLQRTERLFPRLSTLDWQQPAQARGSEPATTPRRRSHRAAASA